MIHVIKMEVGEAKLTHNVRWERIALSQISEFITKGSTPTTFGFNWVEKGIPFLRSECVTDDGFNTKGLSFISVEANKVLERSKIISGDILITITGNVGRIAIYPNEMSVGNINQHIARVRITAKEKVDSTFVYYQLKNPAFREYYNGIVTGAAYPQLSLKQIRDTVIVCPSLETQQRIASILSTYDDLIEVNNQRIKLLEETARELYKEWFVRMRFPGYKKAKFVKGVPEGWEVVRIDSLYKTSSGGTPSREKPEYYDNGIYNWIKTGELNDSFVFETDEKISEIGLKKSSAKLFPPYTTIFAMYGNTIGQLGITTMPSATNQACCALMPLTNEYDFEFLFLTLLLNRNEIISFGMGAAQQNVNQDELKKYKILKPTSDLAVKFKAMTNPMFQQIEILKQQNTQLRQIRDRLLPRLISGKLSLNGDLYDGDDGHDSKSLKSNKSNKS